MSAPAANNASWARLLVAELVRCGVDYAVVAPGSRSTPLVMALADSDAIECTVCHDERGAAFHALGYARATRRPATVVCTSGTAVANMLPAVVEAATDAQPMLVVTADRPWELQDSGANQTIEQRDIFGGYAVWGTQLPPPDPRVAPRALLSAIDQAVHRCLTPVSGPVHVNVAFREPLDPGDAAEPVAAGIERWDRELSAGGSPLTTYLADGGAALPDLDGVVGALRAATTGLVVAGRGATEGQRSAAPAIGALAAALGWPLLGDATSGVTGTPGLQLLLSTTAGRRLGRADTVLLFGAAPTTKGFLQMVSDDPPQTYLQVASSSRRLDPTHLVSHRVVASPAMVAERLLPLLGTVGDVAGSTVSDAAAAAHRAARDALPHDRLSEPLVAQTVAAMAQRPLGLFVGSSMPIRDLDSFAAPLAADLSVAANRGASGIDGSIATALGFATGLGAPVVALIGDTAAIHDASSLAQLQGAAHGLVLVVVNNRGGGIFSMLPIAAQADAATFERYFGAPHEVSFADLAAAFGLAHRHPDDHHALVAALADAYQRATTGGSTLVEVTTDRAANAALHAAVANAVAQAVG